jgi:hypothetical protein
MCALKKAVSATGSIDVKTRILDVFSKADLSDSSLFSGISLVEFSGLSFSIKIEFLKSLDVNKNFISQYPKEIINLIDKLHPSYKEFLGVTNGFRARDGLVSVAGLPLTSHATMLRVPTCLFTVNILEKQVLRNKGEIYLGATHISRLLLFMDNKSGKIFQRPKHPDDLALEANFSDIAEMMCFYLNPHFPG